MARLGRTWASCGEGQQPEGREDPGGDEGPPEARGENRREGGQMEGPTNEEELGARGSPMEALEAQGLAEEAVAEGDSGTAGVTASKEGPEAGVDAQGQLLMAQEAGRGWLARVQGQSMEGEQESPSQESQAQSALGAGETETMGAGDPQDLEDAGCPADRDPQQQSEAGPEARREAEGCAERGEAHGCWNESLLPTSLLDVSVSRSRVLLSRNASQRRSRSSFRRIPALETQREPPSPPLGEMDSVPQQSLLKPEEPPQPSTPTSEGTPVPVRRRPLGHGFGVAHLGMMQELQARLGQPKPQ